LSYLIFCGYSPKKIGQIQFTLFFFAGLAHSGHDESLEILKGLEDGVAGVIKQIHQLVSVHSPEGIFSGLGGKVKAHQSGLAE